MELCHIKNDKQFNRFVFSYETKMTTIPRTLKLLSNKSFHVQLQICWLI